MKNCLFDVIEKRKQGIVSGVPSFCCSNKIVIEAILERSKKANDLCLIEATSNQVNQYGGYMGMTPSEFRDYTYAIADKIGFDKSEIILGGDHMGPLPWMELPAREAMENAKKLVRLCVLAGYKKIHLDTSMKLGDDPIYQKLSDDIIAERGLILYKECIKAYEEMLENNPEEIRPVFVVGSEVPIPGGARAGECSAEITSVKDLETMISSYRNIFAKYGEDKGFDDIIAVVVQPGVEFCENNIIIYDSNKAFNLCNALKRYPNLVFEGHSTDYQPPEKLKEMVNDGIAIIKVGPALSYALREGLFSLAFIEKELIKNETEQSHFIEILDDEMLKNSKYWEKYYQGSETQKSISRKYSFSDRCRYYFIQPNVERAIQKLFENIDANNIPLGLLHQYMPAQYKKVLEGQLSLNSRDLVKDNVVNVIDNYYKAVG